tara:strand:- start:9513 stop:10550 length:1038 start_codon:yes stop_codon:yes gene_type:complete
MKFHFTALALLALLTFSCKKTKSETTTPETPDTPQYVFTADVDNFWKAHDAIRKEADTTKHLALLDSLFIKPGTPGLAAIREARRYRPEEYVHAIRSYPLLWESIRENTYQSKGLSQEIASGIEKLKELYPDARPAEVYFSVGVFRTGGTTMGNKVLIGVETGFGDKNVNVSELPESLNYIREFWAGKESAVENFALNNVHEYIHTQQDQDLDSNLLGISVFEGVAEFVSTLAMGFSESTQSAVVYGKANSAAIKKTFTKDMFKNEYGYWLWSQEENEFGTRDLAYYIGYAIAENYYHKSTDKQAAIKKMIELDHYNPAEIERFVDASGFFEDPIATYKVKDSNL